MTCVQPLDEVFEGPAEEFIREPPIRVLRSGMMLVLWCTCEAETVGDFFGGMSIGEMRSFVLNNDAASLDLSQGKRTPLDYVAP